MKRNVIVTNGYDLWKNMFSDVVDSGGTIQGYPYNKYDSSKKDRFLFHVCNNRLCKKYLQEMWFRHLLKKWGVNLGGGATILFLNPSLPYVEVELIKFLDRIDNIDIGLLFIDSIKCLKESSVKQITPLISAFGDNVFTYDPVDAEEQRWNLTYQYYSNKSPAYKEEIKYDVFLILYNKGREKKAVQLYDYLKQRHIKCLFFLNGIRPDFADKNPREGIIYNNVISYEEIIEYVKRSRVIVELCQANQGANTLRAFEAVVYDRKIITDNRNIIRFPYYNDDMMKYFYSIEDLDQIPDDFFTTDNTHKEYQYEDCFSPIHLIDHISNKQSE